MADHGLNVISNSVGSTYHNCARMHYFSHERGLEPTERPRYFSFGDVGHGVLDHVWEAKGAVQDDFINEAVWDMCRKNQSPYQTAYEHEIEAYTLVALLLGYQWYWQGNFPETVATESEFRHPVMPPYHRGKYYEPDWTAAGKRDKLVKLSDNRIMIVDHKFLAQDLDDEFFWQQLQIDSQVSMYWWSCMMDGQSVDGALYDVIRKPTIRPYKATPEEKRKYKKDGTLYSNMREEDEKPRDWCDRLLKDITEKPEKYYRRREVVRTNDDVKEFAKHLWQTTRMINAGRQYNWWPKNTKACVKFTRCPYFRLCAEHSWPFPANEVPDGFSEKGWRHPELNQEIEDDSEKPTDTTTTVKSPAGSGGGSKGARSEPSGGFYPTTPQDRLERG